MLLDAGDGVYTRSEPSGDAAAAMVAALDNFITNYDDFHHHPEFRPVVSALASLRAEREAYNDLLSAASRVNAALIAVRSMTVEEYGGAAVSEAYGELSDAHDALRSIIEGSKGAGL